MTLNAIYLLIYQTERIEQNSSDLERLNEAVLTPEDDLPPLSHPGGRRFESG